MANLPSPFDPICGICRFGLISKSRLRKRLTPSCRWMVVVFPAETPAGLKSSLGKSVLCLRCFSSSVPDVNEGLYSPGGIYLFLCWHCLGFTYLLFGNFPKQMKIKCKAQQKSNGRGARARELERS